MTDPDDHELLTNFAATGSEEAFRELVRRHLDHVHSVARRVTHSEELAAEVSQQVFARLAARARLPGGVPLSAWLHVTTRSLAVDVVRSESARRRREERYHQQTVMNPAPDDSALWKMLEPVIDDVVAGLPILDREVILLRFYRNCSHAEIGGRLRITGDAARMRVNRALDKVRSQLARRGIAGTSAALALLLPAHAVAAAPSGLAASISSAVITAGTAASAVTSTTLLTMTKSQLTAVAAIVVAAPIIGLQCLQNSRLEEQLETSRKAYQAHTASASHDSAGKPPANLPADAPGLIASKEAGVPGGAGVSLREILARRDPAGRMQSLLDYVNRLPAAKLPGAIAELQDSSPEWDPEAKMVLHMMLTRWAKEDPDAAMASLDSLGAKNRGERAGSILASLAAADPKRAADWLASPDNKLADFPMMGHILAGTLGKEWMRQDADAALAWAAALPESQRGGAYVGILGTMAGTDPAKAAGIAVRLEPGDARRNILGDIGEAWARKAPQEAVAWVQSLDPADRPAALRDTLASWAGAEPADAAKFVQSLPAEEATGAVLKAVAEPWTVRAPADAAAWVLTQADGQARNEAIGSVLWNWTKQNPAEASSWLRQQPAGPARDSAIGGLALAAFDNDPAGAITWAAQMADGQKRDHAVNLGLTEWLKRDPQAATAWAGQNSIALPQLN